MNYKKIFLICLILLIAIIGIKMNKTENIVKAEEVVEECACWTTVEYRCAGECDGNLLRITCWHGCCSGCITEVAKDCEPWQKCDANRRSCDCAGECLEAPQNPRYFNNPLHSGWQKNRASIGNTNIKLPVKLDWDNVDGWKKANFITPLPPPPDIIQLTLTEEEQQAEREALELEGLPPGTPRKPIPFTPIEGEVALPIDILLQADPAWGRDLLFTPDSTITVGSVGCLITSIAMALRHFDCRINNELITPGHIAEIVRTNFWVPGEGTLTGDLINFIKKNHCQFNWGRVRRVPPAKIIDSITEHLKQGRPVVAGFHHYGRGTNYGNKTQHWILIRGITKDGNFIVNDTVHRWNQAHGERISRETLINFKPRGIFWFDKAPNQILGFLNTEKTTLNSQNLNTLASLTRREDNYKFVNSYRINIAGREFILNNSEFIPPPCLLKSGATHNWQVQACCSPDGRDCGLSSNWRFSTNNAPELILPQDPDWVGERKETREPLDTTLKWCESDFKYERSEQPLSYKLKVFKVQNERDICHPFLRIGRECRPKILREIPMPIRYPSPEFLNEEHNLFTINNIYSWQIAVCKDRAATECTEFSQRWRFQIDDTLQPPRLLAPPNSRDIPVGLPVLLQWETPLGAKSFVYHIYQDNERIIRGISASPNVSFDHPQLALNTIYTWRIMPCWDERGRNCETNAWSEPRFFKTTGRPPRPETMKPTGIDIPIPTFFEWEAVPGARSYIFKIWGGNLDRELITEEPKTSLVFPDLLQNTPYTWKVRTCARPGGGLCGDWTVHQIFTTFTLGVPTELRINPHKDNDPLIVFTGDLHTFSWKLNASHHQFKLIYQQRAGGEEREKCIALERKEKTKILTTNSLFLPLECRGSYQWQVRGCLDKECTETGAGAWSNPQNITLLAAMIAEPARARGAIGGLVPCGRRFDNPNTPWNETERCEIRHIFVLFYSILNFFLWTILPLVLIVLVVYTGAIFYFSLSTESDEALPKVKALWKSVGIGFGIIFLAWIFVSWALTLLNYQVGIFGPWWQI